MSNVKKMGLAAVLAILTVFPSGLAAQDNVIDEVVMVVGEEAILKSDVEEYLLTAQNNGQKFTGDPYCQIVEELAVQKLFLHQADIDSVTANESSVLRKTDAQMSYVLDQIGSKEKMEEYFNKTSNQIREIYMEQIRNTEIMQAMKEKIVGDIKVTPAQVRRFYNTLPQDSIPYVPVQVEVQIITQEPPIPIAEIERVKAELRDYTDRINSGQTQFSTLALFYSEDKESARKGGELDYAGRGDFTPAFATVAFNLTDPNKVSKIVETEYGFHIIQLIDKRGDRIKVRHILRKPRVSDESLQQTLSRLDSIANDIRNQKFTFDQGASVISSDKDTRNNYGNMYNNDTGSSKFEMQDLPQEVAKAVEKLNVGEISAPFTMIDKKGRTLCAIVKLKSKINGHKATVKDDYQTLHDLYQQELSNNKINDWIKQKQKSTYVRIKDDLKNCDFKYPGWTKNQ